MEQILIVLGFLFLGILIGAFGGAKFAFNFYKRQICKLPREARIKFENLATNYNAAHLDPEAFPVIRQIMAEYTDDKKIAMSLLLRNATKIELAAALCFSAEELLAKHTLHTAN